MKKKLDLNYRKNFCVVFTLFLCVIPNYQISHLPYSYLFCRTRTFFELFLPNKYRIRTYLPNQGRIRIYFTELKPNSYLFTELVPNSYLCTEKVPNSYLWTPYSFKDTLESKNKNCFPKSHRKTRTPWNRKKKLSRHRKNNIFMKKIFF